jgi:cholesterol transport system auxiliary component
MIRVPRRAAASCARPAAALSLVMVALLASSGCSSLLPSSGAAPVTYVLRPAVVAQATAAAPASSLQVQRVAVAPGYARDEVLLTQPDRRLDVYAASRWPDTLPVVMERLVVDALRQRGAWSVVHDAAAPFAADRLLRVTVRRFDAEYASVGQPPTVRVVMDATLARRGDRTVVSSFTVEAAQAASADRMSAIVAAFEQATGEALDRLAERAAADSQALK